MHAYMHTCTNLDKHTQTRIHARLHAPDKRIHYCTRTQRQRKRARVDRSGVDEILTLAVVRTCGDKCLEMPFVVTPSRHRRKGTDTPPPLHT